MRKIYIFGLMFTLVLAGCMEIDESQLVTDDVGTVHITPNFIKDNHGRNYFPPKTEPIGKRQFIFDPKISAWAAYDEQGRLVITGSGSGGKDFCEDVNEECRTITGSFSVYNKKGKDCLSGEYPVQSKGGARMPYCMYFYRGFTIHAAYEVPHHSTSHGCIRVWPSAAKWLNEQFLTKGSRVVVLSYLDDNQKKLKAS